MAKVSKQVTRMEGQIILSWLLVLLLLVLVLLLLLLSKLLL